MMKPIIHTSLNIYLSMFTVFKYSSQFFAIYINEKSNVLPLKTHTHIEIQKHTYMFTALKSECDLFDSTVYYWFSETVSSSYDDLIH